MKNEELIKALRVEPFEVESIGLARIMNNAADALEAAEKRIAELKAQLPKEGEWIGIDGTMFSECSVCGERHYGCETPFCDMCGAKMRTVTDCHTFEER